MTGTDNSWILPLFSLIIYLQYKLTFYILKKWQILYIFIKMKNIIHFFFCKYVQYNICHFFVCVQHESYVANYNINIEFSYLKKKRIFKDVRCHSQQCQYVSVNFGCLVQVGKMYGLRSVAPDDILLLLTDGIDPNK